VNPALPNGPSAPAWLVRGATFWAVLLVLALFTSTALLNLAALGMSLWAAAAWAHLRPWHLLRQPLAWAIAALLGWMLLREAWATASLDRTLWVLVEFRVLLFALLWAPLFAWALPRRWAAGAMLFSSGVAALAALTFLAITGAPPGYMDYRIATNIAGQLMVIGVMGWVLVGLVAVRQLPPKRLAVLAAVVLAALCVAAMLFASTRRTGWVVMVAAGGALIAAQAVVLSRRQLTVILTAMAAAVVVAAASPMVQKRVNDIAVDLQKYQAAAPEDRGRVDVSTGIRLRMWQISLTLIEERPLVGTSFSAFPREYKRIDNARGGSPMHGFNPHNEYLQIFAMFGLVGLLLYLSIYAALLQRAWQWRGSTQGTLVLVCTAALASSVLMNSMLIDMMEGHLFAVVVAGLAFHRWPDEPNSRAA
jgi:O-antigen ligase